MFVAVLGVLLTSADPLTLYLTYTDHIFGPGSWEKWFVGIPLILALALSVLNAIMGVGRSLYQAAEDGQLPRWFEHKNRHGVPDYAMAFNVVCAALLVLLGSPVRIYIISNGGYLLSCALAFAGYFVYRHLRPDEHAAVPAADVREVGRARGLRHLDGHLLLRRLELAERRGRARAGALALPARAAHRRPVRPAVLVARLAGPQAGRGRPTPVAAAVPRVPRVPRASRWARWRSRCATARHRRRTAARLTRWAARSRPASRPTPGSGDREACRC